DVPARVIEACPIYSARWSLPRTLPAVELVAQGTGGDDPAPRRLTARIVAAGRHAYQAVVLESGEAARDTRQQEQVDQFLASFHPY
ncbi:hypothetical protein ACQUWY_17260, partial [Ralstonia pseudosolanacearum]